MGKTEHLSFRVPPELKDELQQLAAADRRELSVYVRLALEDHVAQEGQKREGCQQKEVNSHRENYNERECLAHRHGRARGVVVILAIMDRSFLSPMYLLVLALVVMVGTSVKFPW